MSKQKYPGELCMLAQVLTDWLFVTSAALLSMGLRAKALQTELDTAKALGSEVEAVRAKVRDALVSGDLKELRRAYSAAQRITRGFSGFEMAGDEASSGYDASGDGSDDVPF